MPNPAAPKSIVKAFLICALSACVYFYAPSAFAQRGGARGGGGFHGGGFHGGGARMGGSHSGGMRGGSHASAHFGGGVRMAPAHISSPVSSGSGVSGMAGAPRANFTGNTFVPPASEGAGHAIFMNAAAPRENTPVGARPFAAGNYLWEAPPQQARPVSPPPAPHPIAQPIARPMNMPSPIRPYVPIAPARPLAPSVPLPLAPPMGSPLARPMVIPTPIAPAPRGGRFFTPPIAVRPLTPVRPALFHPLPPVRHALPVPPVLGGLPLGSSAALPPRTAASGPFAGSSRTPPHPCINTIARCGLGGGFLDGDGDFDNDGFFGPFGFSPLGFGSTCFFNGFFQNCFLSPVEFAPFGFGAFGPFGNPWFSPYNFGPYYGSNLLYAPPENLPAPELQYAPSENYAPAIIYEPAPETSAPEQASPEANAQQPVVELVLNDGTVFGVTSYWLSGDRLYYITTYKIQSSIPFSQLDLQRTVDMNYKRGVPFTLTPQPPSPNPPPAQPQQPPSPPPY